MAILAENAKRYLTELRPSVPIVHGETGRVLAVICRALDPVVARSVPVGDGIGFVARRAAS